MLGRCCRLNIRGFEQTLACLKPGIGEMRWCRFVKDKENIEIIMSSCIVNAAVLALRSNFKGSQTPNGKAVEIHQRRFSG